MENLENWKLLFFDCRYKVSDTGRVVSLFYWKSKTQKEKELSPNFLGDYKAVFIKGKWRTIHRLVVEHFIGPIPKGMQVNHINGIKTDNRAENLEIVTPSENTRHAYRVLGFTNNKSNLGNFYGNSFRSVRINQLDKSGVFVKSWDCIREASHKLDISETAIANALNARAKTSGGFIWQYA